MAAAATRVDWTFVLCPERAADGSYATPINAARRSGSALSAADSPS